MVAFESVDPAINVFSLQKFLEKNRKWKVNTLNYPPQSMNFLFTGNNASEESVPLLVKQIKDGIK